MTARTTRATLATLTVMVFSALTVVGHDEPKGTSGEAAPHEAQGATRCSNNRAGDFPCQRIDLAAFVPLEELGGGSANDIWGWTDPATGREYALLGRSGGTSFVDVTDPENPIWVGELPTRTNPSGWRDIKVIGDFAFIVSEAARHGLQVFRMTRLRNVTDPPRTFAPSAVYDGFGSAHNFAVNEDSGFGYAVGTAGDSCAGGLHMVDLSKPLSPTFAGCFAEDGYTHDAQCVFYDGPDRDHAGKEICFAFNEDTVTIVDVTDKRSPALISRSGYDGNGYSHQGWLTEDHRYLLADDELDERGFGSPTRTFVWDVQDLDKPRVTGVHEGRTTAIDHNQYVLGQHVFQANYRRGLSILHLDNLAQGRLREVAFFDVYPADDAPEFSGAWSVYPYFASGTVVVSSIESGLFALRPRRLAGGGKGSGGGGGRQSQIAGLRDARVDCRNETSQQKVSFALDGASQWSCAAAGLAVSSGDRLRQEVRGEATGAAIRLTAGGVTTLGGMCRNLDSGKSAPAEPGSAVLDCAARGVTFDDGDRALVTLRGRID